MTASGQIRECDQCAERFSSSPNSCRNRCAAEVFRVGPWLVRATPAEAGAECGRGEQRDRYDQGPPVLRIEGRPDRVHRRAAEDPARAQSGGDAAPARCRTRLQVPPAVEPHLRLRPVRLRSGVAQGLGYRQRPDGDPHRAPSNRNRARCTVGASSPATSCIAGLPTRPLVCVAAPVTAGIRNKPLQQRKCDPQAMSYVVGRML